MEVSGNAWDYVFVFFGGVTLSFSPCVYPLIPVTAGFIGVNGKASRMRGFFLSFLYVTGLAATYAALGLAATLTGKMFGAISVHPATQVTVGVVFILFGLSMFNVFAIYFPSIARLSRVQKGGLWSVVLLGLVSGLVASPCVAPALGAILVYLATTKNVIYGVTLLVTFAYGMGLTLILAGTFSAALLRLPKAGRWMLYFERAAACVLIAAGIYFIFNALRRL